MFEQWIIQKKVGEGSFGRKAGSPDGNGTLELFTAEVVRFGELWFFLDVFLLAAMTQTYSGEEDSRAFMEALDNQNLAPMEIVIEPNLEVKLPK